MNQPQTGSEDRQRSQDDSHDDPAETPSGYYYDDSTGYEKYEDEDQPEEDEVEEGRPPNRKN